jgi:peroxiredoxin
MPSYARLAPGDPAPWFTQRSFANPRYAFDTAGGRYIVLCFFASAGDDHSKAAIAAVRSRPDIFDDERACFFGVSVDPRDELENRIADSYPGYRYFWDFDGTIGRLYGILPHEPEGNAAPGLVNRTWVVVDPMLRVVNIVPFDPDRKDIDAVLSCLDGLPPSSRLAGFEVQAPILVLPNVLEPDVCRSLIGLYETAGGEESGFMREEDGRTVGVLNDSHKRRKDCTIQDPNLVADLKACFARRVVPMVGRAYQFQVTRMERFIVSCYAAQERGHFRAHRDNTTKGTAHRRFAVTVNLNDDYDGGELSFPEYGPRSYKPPVGCAVVFSCSLLHAVSRMRHGKRYAFLPFLYDDAAAKIREENSRFLADGASAYKAG